jgi:phosphoribosylformimino-5-aminoimidazole carboxamide ribotide isomerase
MNKETSRPTQPEKQPFVIFPAIDLREGQVVRLKEGDPGRQTNYSTDPAAVAERWLNAGARWLHVINLDGAFGQDDALNIRALTAILKLSDYCKARIQFGGGLRDKVDIKRAFDLGVSRVILGTLVVHKRHVLPEILQQWGAGQVAVSLDARDESIQDHGWQKDTSKNVFSMAGDMQKDGLEWLIYTDISRDGMLSGINQETSLKLAHRTGLKVIASGGVSGENDILAARNSGLAGIIVGRALYEGVVDITRLWSSFSEEEQPRSG